MKLMPVYIFFITCIAACSNKPKSVLTTTEAPDKEQLQKAAFETWLESHKLSSAYFKDSMAEKADSLWAYAFPLERTDTLYRWYPSIDSSYYLLTNIDRESRKNVLATDKKKAEKGPDSEDIEYRFLETRNKTVFIGITLLKTGPLSPIDFHWYDNKKIHLLVQDKINSDYELVTLKMGVDTIWSYRNKKVEMPANATPSSGQ